MRALILSTTVLILGSRIMLFASDYRWPMKLAPELTSRFCDNRSGHFHAGLDIRTRGKTGYRIYAVDDGHIFRISASYSGYGKAIYLKLKDGRIAVYGHLLSFDNTLDERIRKIQMEQKRYRQDLYFNPGQFPVKKGQILGLSGASGSGAPHLHFEVRSANNNPINPLKFGFASEDHKPPEFHDLAIRVYHNRFDPGAPSDIEITQLLKNGRNFEVADSLVIDGYAALAVSGGDKIDGNGFLYGFYSLRLFLDDSLIFASTADSISYQTTNQQDYVRDIQLGRLVDPGNKKDNDKHVFHKLYIPDGARQFFWADPDKSGIIPPSKQPGQARSFEIVATDEAGNESRVKGILVSPKLDPPEPEFMSFYRFGDTLEVDFLTLDTVNSCNLQQRNSLGSNFESLKHSLKTQTWNRDGAVAYLNTLRAVSPYANRDYRLLFSNESADLSPWVYFVDATGKSGLNLEGSPGCLRLDYYPDSIHTSLSIEIVSPTRSIGGEMRQGGIQTFYYDIRDVGLEGETKISIRDNANVIFDTKVTLFAAGIGNRIHVVSPDSALTLIVDNNSMFFPIYIFPSAGTHENVMGKNAAVFDIEPVDILADNPIVFQFDKGRLGLESDKMGVYGYAPSNDKWGFIGTNAGNILEIEGFGLGKVAVLEDNDPPSIKSIKPSGRIKSRKPLLSCVITDDLSGVNLDSAPRMWIDGIWVPAEYDLSSKTFTYQVRSNLKSGRHSLAVEADDNQGNTNRKSVNFTIGG